MKPRRHTQWITRIDRFRRLQEFAREHGMTTLWFRVELLRMQSQRRFSEEFRRIVEAEAS